MRKFAIVKTRGPYRRYWLALDVKHRDLGRGLNTDRTGLHLFSGYWYGREKFTTFKSHKAYGKICHIMPADARVIGYARNSYLIRKLMR